MTTQIDYPDQTEKVLLTKEEYDEMIKRLHWLRCIEDKGIECWNRFCEAENLFKRKYPDNEPWRWK